MQTTRKTLTVRAPAPISDDPAAVLQEAIGRKTCVTAVYNKVAVQVAPHIVYTKHGDLFVDAVVVLRDGKPPRETKLGTFKLAGLSAVAPTRKTFEPLPVFNGGDSKYEGVAVSIIDA
jgi:hypothetical protein